MKIRDILRQKGSEVVTVAPELRVLDAMRVLVENNIGSVVVVEGGSIRGILTERDVLRLGAANPARLATDTVAETMTQDLMVGVPDDDLEYVMTVMVRNRIRHLPIVDDGRLAGMVSIGDVVNALRTSAEAENRYLRDYIQGVMA